MTSIEDKAKYENETGKKLPDNLSANCETCEKETVYVFAHIQPGYNRIKDTPIYDCTGGCRRSRTYQTLIETLNGRVIELSQ